jgi:hypothetical protein
MSNFIVNPFTSLLDANGSGESGLIPTAASDPTGASNGQQYINTSTNEFKISFCGSWQAVFTFTCTPSTDSLLLEDGFYLLLESGDKLLLE